MKKKTGYTITNITSYVTPEYDSECIDGELFRYKAPVCIPDGADEESIKKDLENIDEVGTENGIIKRLFKVQVTYSDSPVYIRGRRKIGDLIYSTTAITKSFLFIFSSGTYRYFIEDYSNCFTQEFYEELLGFHMDTISEIASLINNDPSELSDKLEYLQGFFSTSGRHEYINFFLAFKKLLKSQLSNELRLLLESTNI